MQEKGKELYGKREVLFLPWKASGWPLMEGLWRFFMEDPAYDALVMPIPWYYRGADGRLLGEMQYEAGAFPEDVPILDFRAYDLSSGHPYMILFQNPYDQYNWASSVDPAFYSGRLRQYADRLVYIPWFSADVFDIGNPEDGKAAYNMRYYAAMPGVVQADLVLVPSGKMREAYIETLTRFAGEESRGLWEQKVQDL